MTSFYSPFGGYFNPQSKRWTCPSTGAPTSTAKRLFHVANRPTSQLAGVPFIGVPIVGRLLSSISRRITEFVDGMRVHTVGTDVI